MAAVAERLAARGYVVVNAEYRTQPKWQFPAPLEDLQAALRRLRSVAADIDVDPQRVGVFGYSAGGHLAALLASDDSNPQTRVQAAVICAAPTDLSLYVDIPAVRHFLGGPAAMTAERLRQASPIRQVHPGMPPMLIYHGAADTLVPVEDARVYYQVLLAAGVEAEFFSVTQFDHGEVLGSDMAIDAAIHFLDKHLR
jgi:acetyl esterase/lipase